MVLSIKRRPASIRVFVLQAIIQNLPRAGTHLKALLTRHGLSDARIGNPNARVDMRDYLEFFEDAARTFEDPVLGARLGFALRPGDLWPIGLLLMQASSIGSALSYYARYATAFQTATTFSVQLSPEGLMCSYKVHDDIKPKSLLRQDTEFTLACICSQIQAAFDSNWRPLEVHLEHTSVGQEAALQRIFGAPVRFGQTRNCIIIDPRDADRQYRVEDREFINILNQHMASVIAASNEEVSATEQVKALISVRLGISPVELPDLASEMGITPRTLQRRLSEEGASIRAILRDYREQMATAYLAQGNVSVEEISAALGYAESTVFSRAFKAWTGKSPARRFKVGKQ
ncbi:AraC family transcriptional regulator [Rhizobium giardinii]|uniref:AraC-like DNA-binding protein n=1 Tax=Rhizobium giardinii TaxID=56731 RepID=A0A7W8UH35_9HYPH|nr:AraC family transcriptional regulator [Rhizobium giardinii]MBB5539128.1 AraC-like DNA-binding protein [Rhizobium giardinii]